MSKDKAFFRSEGTPGDYAASLGDPGEFPFTRGIYPTMYRGKKPTIRQFAGHGLASDTNGRFKKILSLGGTGLSTAFDLPTLMGRDSDDPACEGQVGWDGVAIDTLADMEDLFDGIPVGEVTVSMTINAPAAAILAMYVAMADKRGIPRANLGGTTQNDILKEYIAQKEWLYPVNRGVQLVTDTIEFGAREMPKWHPVSISGYHIREAGASAVQELAYTLADGLCYVQKSIERGLAIDEFAPRLSFFFDVHNDFFEEIAKLRAARRLWAKLIQERYHPKDNRSLWCRIHAQTAGCTLTRKEPMNNVMRVAYQALAALLGGVQSVHTNSYDEVLCTPTEKALQIAVRTQQVLQEETGVCITSDPLGGSWFIEHLTDTIEKVALREIETIEALGGMEKAIAAHYPQRGIHETAMRDQEMLEKGERKVVGVNVFCKDSPQDDELGQVFAEVEARKEFHKRQLERLARVKRERSQESVQNALDTLKRQAGLNVNVMGAMIEAVKVYATIGEISKALQDVWGSYREGESTASHMPKHKILEAIGGAKFSRPVRILLAKAGLDGHTRGLWILADMFRAMGGEVIMPGLHSTIKEVAKAAVEEDVEVIGLSALIGSPAVFFSMLKDELARYGAKNILVTGGGIILPHEQQFIERELGLGRVFLPDTPLADIARYLVEEVEHAKS